MPKKITKSLPGVFPSVTLFLDDLECIIQTIEETTGEPVRIYDNEYEYDSLDELKAFKGEPIKHLSISSSSMFPCIHLRIDSDDLPTVYLSVREDSEKAIAAYHSISQILTDRRRWFGFLSDLPEVPSWLMVLCVVAMNFWFLPTPLNMVVCMSGFLVFAYLILTMVGWAVDLGWFTRVYLCKQHELSENVFAKILKKFGGKILLIVIVVVLTKSFDYVWDRMVSEPSQTNQSDSDNQPEQQGY